MVCGAAKASNADTIGMNWRKRKLAYTQSPPLTDEEIESFLKKGEVARFCSLNADGTIHAVPVNYSYTEGQIEVVTPVASRKARNVRRNKNVTLLIDDSGTKGVWPKGVIVYGEARLDAADLTLGEFTRLCERYFLGDRAESYARGLLGLTRWVKMVVTPKHMHHSITRRIRHTRLLPVSSTLKNIQTGLRVRPRTTILGRPIPRTHGSGRKYV
jgi:general stress protein 26